MGTAQNLLFSWDAVDQLPDLRRPRLILEALPDETLLAALETRRGRPNFATFALLQPRFGQRWRESGNRDPCMSRVFASRRLLMAL